jgi:hypothetical protein
VVDNDRCHMALPAKKRAIIFLNFGYYLVVHNTYRTYRSCGTNSCVLEQYYSRNTEDSEMVYTFEHKSFIIFFGMKRSMRINHLIYFTGRYNRADILRQCQKCNVRFQTQKSFKEEIWRMKRKYIKE